ncbi:uncharacterized protein LOC143231403 isoform X1 [Tachypleus tridentatus]|uniref:uncharacterized protein LOC143231403 isoform X1 n=1 Tax=Tachypleus tridentatus TaxID=6853 RepID=UPI003FD4F0F8
MKTTALLTVLSVLVHFASAQPIVSGEGDGKVHRNHQLPSIQRKSLYGATDFSLNFRVLKHLQEFLQSELMKEGKENGNPKGIIIERLKMIIRKSKTARLCKIKVCTMTV